MRRTFLKSIKKQEKNKKRQRFEQVYYIVKMALIDGTTDKNEMRLAGSFAAKSGFEETKISNLLSLLIRGIREDKDWEDLFDAYKKDERFENYKNLMALIRYYKTKSGVQKPFEKTEQTLKAIKTRDKKN